ncbi:Bifunctional protein RIB2 [Candida viswanathii]|uniref:tRNA pseudouridine(32) synthase n=1 Tax=Candida viswanathii TaxID=5486 RepID=A0A367YH20_9ASCO|nr:Bifunctional protein RIB2 [Candida viswanathii]
MLVFRSPVFSSLRNFRAMSTESSQGMKRAASPSQSTLRSKLVDSQGFRVRQQDVDKHKLSEGDNTKTIHEEETEGANYVIEGRLRRVTPYYYTYLTYCKMRWIGRKLVDVFIDEFRDRSAEAYREAVDSGLVKVNSKPANLETVLKDSDLISHRSYRREPPVTSREVRIVFENDELLAIDKPSGIPVHPTGRYRYNTVTKIIEQELGKTVHPCNRLDRLTSGLMFLGKLSQGARNMMSQIRDRNVSKEYIARVKGEFPIERLTVDKPLTTIAPKLTLNVVDEENGKEAKTEFQRISYDPITGTSVVKCHPLTGRTHQIRVHLQYLGYPIANDPIYSSEFVWGENLGKNGEADLEKVKKNLDMIGKSKPATSWFHPEGDGEVLLDELCPITGLPLYSDPGPNDLDLWLHAYKYAADDGSWSYKTQYPEWALEPSRKFMELAIEQAEKCGETQTQFNVGCVLVYNGEIISTGHSRELPGNTHAEQCALEKYFAEHNGVKEVPEGTEIFTSMEPCSLRLSGNLPCVDRILETKGIKTCFVGVLEPNIFVKNNSSYQKLLDNGVEYIHIPGYEEQALEIAKRGHEKIGA